MLCTFFFFQLEILKLHGKIEDLAKKHQVQETRTFGKEPQRVYVIAPKSTLEFDC